MNHLPLSLEGRVAVITGGGSGIGAAMATLFARSGATVVVAGRNGESLKSVVRACAGVGNDRAWAMPTDVSSPEEVSALFAEVEEREGRLDILVNNAAPTDSTTAKSFAEHTEEDWAMFVDVILIGTARCCSAGIPLLRDSRGTILNISSVHATSPRNAAGYAACKAGLENLTRKLAVELAPDGVRVNALAPGWIATEGVAWSLADKEATARAVKDCIPLNRLGRPDEIAQVGLFLVSDMASYMTGSVVLADGGWLLR